MKVFLWILLVSLFVFWLFCPLFMSEPDALMGAAIGIVFSELLHERDGDGREDRH